MNKVVECPATVVTYLFAAVTFLLIGSVVVNLNQESRLNRLEKTQKEVVEYLLIKELMSNKLPPPSTSLPELWPKPEFPSPFPPPTSLSL